MRVACLLHPLQPPTQRIREEWYHTVLRRQDELLRRLDTLTLPGNPLDLIIQEMSGPKKVAESKLTRPPNQSALDSSLAMAETLASDRLTLGRGGGCLTL